jgi:Na+-transporting methylmalonyl-CoA/oxaloacetate decarboxylase gamma subunit
MQAGVVFLIVMFLVEGIEGVGRKARQFRMRNAGAE